MEFYILNDDGEIEVTHDVLVWGRWFETGERHLAWDMLSDGSVISTVFIGLDHSFWAGIGPHVPLLWETMVFNGPLADEQDRYATREEALRGHEAMVTRVRKEMMG
jgi:hypothetical protein